MVTTVRPGRRWLATPGQASRAMSPRRPRTGRPRAGSRGVRVAGGEGGTCADQREGRRRSGEGSDSQQTRVGHGGPPGSGPQGCVAGRTRDSTIMASTAEMSRGVTSCTSIESSLPAPVRSCTRRSGDESPRTTSGARIELSVRVPKMCVGGERGGGTVRDERERWGDSGRDDAPDGSLARTLDDPLPAAAHVVPHVPVLPGRGGHGRLRDRTCSASASDPSCSPQTSSPGLLAVLPFGRLQGRELVLLVVVLCLYESAGLYRSRLSLSVLDDLPALVGRALAAAAITTTIALAIDEALVDVRLLEACPWCSPWASSPCAASRTGRPHHPAPRLGQPPDAGAGCREDRRPARQPAGRAPLLRPAPGRLPRQRPAPARRRAARAAARRAGVAVLDHRGVRRPGRGRRLREHVRSRSSWTSSGPATGWRPRSSSSRACSSCTRRAATWTRSGACRWFACVGRPSARPSWRLKRLCDVVVVGCRAAGAGALCSPRRAGGAAGRAAAGCIFRQQRVGLDGQPFDLLKFRSLRPVDEVESQTRWNIAHDARLGPVGRFLRRTSLDELPQLWNILRGDMTLVGPRPERPAFVEAFSASFPRYTARHRVPGRADRLGAGARPARGHLHLRARPLRQLLHRELVPVGGRQDRPADRVLRPATVRSVRQRSVRG